MHRWLMLGLCSCLLAPAVQAQDADSRAIVEKALKVHGGEKLATSVKALHAKGKGVLHINNTDVDVTVEIFANLPNQTKMVANLSVGGMTINLVQVVDGDKGWVSFNGQVADLNADQLKEAKQKKYVESVTGLQVLKDPAYKLATLGESKVGDTPVVGVLVSHKDQPDVNLYFDKKTSMLLKADYRIYSAEKGQEMHEEKIFLEYKEVLPGVKSAVKTLIKKDGEKHAQLELTEIESVPPHDASVFAKPK
jgi:hypothetical protein